MRHGCGGGLPARGASASATEYRYATGGKGASQALAVAKPGGAYLCSKAHRERIGFRVNAVDTTAAGDTFSAAFCAGYSPGKPIVEAIRYAHAAAVICVARKGGQPSIPDRREAGLLYEEHCNGNGRSQDV